MDGVRKSLANNRAVASCDGCQSSFSSWSLTVLLMSSRCELFVISGGQAFGDLALDPFARGLIARPHSSETIRATWRFLRDIFSDQPEHGL